MGKKTNKKRQHAKKSPYGPLLALCAGVAVILLLLVLALRGCSDNEQPDGQDTTPGMTQNATLDQNDKTPDETESERYDIEIPVQSQEEIQLEETLKVVQIGRYTGIYMEDGSDEILSGIMMIQVENTSEQDLQLARIEIAYADVTAQFEVTNLPAGKSAVLLEKNRLALPEGEYQSVAIKNMLYFDQAMSLEAERLEITGGTGYLDVTNISGEDISGVIYIYYKNSASDLYYGGITYRAKIDGGIEAGATMRVLTNHYSPDTCAIVMVTCGE